MIGKYGEREPREAVPGARLDDEVLEYFTNALCDSTSG